MSRSHEAKKFRRADGRGARWFYLDAIVVTANLDCSAKPGSDWTFNDLESYNIALRQVGPFCEGRADVQDPPPEWSDQTVGN